MCRKERPPWFDIAHKTAKCKHTFVFADVCICLFDLLFGQNHSIKGDMLTSIKLQVKLRTRVLEHVRK